MRNILSIAWKDVLQILREWKAAFFMLVMPILFTLFFGLVFQIDDNTETENVEEGTERILLTDSVDIEGMVETGLQISGSSLDRQKTEQSMEKLLIDRSFVTKTIPIGANTGQGTDENDREIKQVPSGFTQSSPGMIIQFTILGLITTAMVLLYERKSKTMNRMIAAPVGFTGIIAGHTIAMLAAVFIQQIILVLIGQIVFKVPYLSRPGPLFLLLFFFALWATSLGILISTLAKKEEQVVTLSIICMFIFSAFGGAWFPLEMAGKTFSAIGHIFPTAWAMDGLQDIILRGEGFSALTYPIIFFIGYTAVFFILAILRLRRLKAEV